MAKKIIDDDGNLIDHNELGTKDVIDCIAMEYDLARSAWFDSQFALWFADHASADVLVSGAAGAEFFRICGEFSRKYKAAPADSGDKASDILTDKAALRWFETVDMPKLPGKATHKPTAWQMEKSRKYLRSRNNILLAEVLMEAERVAAGGDQERADRMAVDARRKFRDFSDAIITCNPAMHDEDAIISLAESVEPYFALDGELGRMLNSRLKPDNFGVILANPKMGKTTFLVNLAVAASYNVPTLLISTGDETELKLNARIATNLSWCVTQPEYAGDFAVPVPDCMHNAQGTCPIGQGGEPRKGKNWKQLIDDGHTPEDLAEGCVDQARTVTGKVYQPCCRCFPKIGYTPEDIEQDKVNRRHWKSAIWWKMRRVNLIDRRRLRATKLKYNIETANGGLKIMSFGSDKLSVPDLEKILEDLDRRDNFVPSVIIIDYADIMKQEVGRYTDKDYDGMRKIFEGLSNLRTTLGNLIITATQTNRTGDEVETHTIKTVGRTAKGIDNCTWFLTLNQTNTEDRAKVMRASMLYAREGRNDSERQALCCQWYEVQDAFAYSMPIFCKIKKGEE